MNVLLPCKWQNQCSATVLTYDVARFVCGWLSSQTRCYTQVLHSEKSRWHQSGFGHWGCSWSVSFIAVAVRTWSVVQGVPRSSLTGDVNSHRHKAPSSVLHVDPWCSATHVNRFIELAILGFGLEPCAFGIAHRLAASVTADFNCQQLFLHSLSIFLLVAVIHTWSWNRPQAVFCPLPCIHTPALKLCSIKLLPSGPLWWPLFSHP